MVATQSDYATVATRSDNPKIVWGLLLPQPKTFSDEVREGFTFFSLHFSLNPSEKVFGGNK